MDEISNLYKMNSYQTPLTEDIKNSVPREIWLELIDFLSSVEFIRRLTATEDIRGFAKERLRETKFYNDGRVDVDLTNPHILEDMDYFRERALFYEKHGKYTHLTPNPNPKSEYGLFWKEELRRWKYGLVRPSDGEWIPGQLYFYWNYSPIWLVEIVKTENTGRKQKGERVRKFAKPWLGDYLFYHYMQQAKDGGMHGKLLKTRGVGFSFKMGAISPCNMFVYPGSGNPNFHLASEKTFLAGDKGIWGKVVDTLDWIAESTPLPRMRTVDRAGSTLEIQLGFKDEYGVRKGLLSSVHGISLKDNPDKARGIRGPLIHYEEDGLFPNLEKAWNVNLKAVEDGDVGFGFMLAGGCLTENNQVWDGLGNLVSIKDLNIKNNILGFNEKDGIISQENITYWQPPTNKECVRIETNTGRFIECSLDHPILYSHKSLKKIKELESVNGKRKRQSLKKVEFKEAGRLQLNDQVVTIEEVPIFSNKEMWEPRLIGWLIGDGSYGFDKTPILSNCEPEINTYLHCCLIEDVVTEKKYITKLGKIYEENRIKGICKKLRNLEIYGQTCSRKTLPKDIHSYSYKTITELIGGFFDTDGYISKNGVISLSCAYKNLLLEMQLLLQKLGIHGNINFKKPNLNNPKSKNGHYELKIKDKDSVLNFVKHISLYPKEKQIRLNSFKEFYKNKNSQKALHLKGMCFEKIIKIENIGIQPVYNLTAGKTNTYIGNGIITHNTGGVEGGSFEGSEKLFYNPSAYEIYGVKNVFDKNSKGDTICGFFWGGYLNRNGCYDEKCGEPDIIKALLQILTNRYKIKYNSQDPNAITQKKAEEPITPQEAIMRTEGTVFPVSDLKDYLESIMVRKESFLAEHYVGELVRTGDGKLKWRLNNDKFPLRSYDKDTANREGCLEIFEMPSENANGEIANGRYIAGIDPIDADSGTSLFSIKVMDLFTDRIVAEFSGRPRLATAL